MPPPMPRPKPIPTPSITAPGGAPRSGGGLPSTTPSSVGGLRLAADFSTRFFGGGSSARFLAGSKGGVVGRFGVGHGQVGPGAPVVGETGGATMVRLRSRSATVRAVAARSPIG